MNPTKQALAELKSLANTARQNIYRRVQLAVQVLADQDWIVREHGGSDLKAQDALQTEFFPDLNGYLSLGKLTAMYRAISKEAWEKCRFDIAAVEVLYDDRVEPETKEQGKRPAWKAIAEERGEKIEVMERQLSGLQAEVARLTAEKHRLEGRIEELERVLEKTDAVREVA